MKDTSAQLKYIDMYQELGYEPNDSSFSIFLAIFDLPEEYIYHLVWTKFYLDTIATEGNLDPEISDYLERRASASPVSIKVAVATIDGILRRLAKDF